MNDSDEEEGHQSDRGTNNKVTNGGRILPPFSDYYVAISRALRSSGGSATIKELERAVATSLALSSEALRLPQRGDSRTKFQYQLAWARTHLRVAGVVNNPKRGVWSLTDKGENTTDDVLRELKSDLPLATLPSLPNQGPGPKFALTEGLVGFAKVKNSVPQGRLGQLHPVLKSIAAELTARLSEESGLWPSLERSSQRYLNLVERHIAEIDYALLFGEGIRLANTVREARSLEQIGNTYPLSAEPGAMADTLLEIHAAFMMSSKDGKALVNLARKFRSSDRTPALRHAERSLTEALLSETAPVKQDVRDHLAGVVDADASSGNAHSPVYRSALLRNIAIVLAGGTVLTALGGLPIAVGAVAGLAAIIGNETLKKTTALKQTTDRFAKYADYGIKKFFGQNEESLRELARAETDHTLLNAIDWLARSRNVESPPATAPEGADRPPQAADWYSLLAEIPPNTKGTADFRTQYGGDELTFKSEGVSFKLTISEAGSGAVWVYPNETDHLYSLTASPGDIVVQRSLNFADKPFQLAAGGFACLRSPGGHFAVLRLRSANLPERSQAFEVSFAFAIYDPDHVVIVP